MNRNLLILTLIAAITGAAGAPEPDAVFYGHVTQSPLNTAYVRTRVTWTLSGNAETLAVSQTTVV